MKAQYNLHCNQVLNAGLKKARWNEFAARPVLRPEQECLAKKYIPPPQQQANNHWQALNSTLRVAATRHKMQRPRRRHMQKTNNLVLLRETSTVSNFDELGPASKESSILSTFARASNSHAHGFPM